MIIKKYLEFKPKQNSLQASYAIVQKKIDTTNIIDNSFLSCEEVRILSQMSNNIRRESFYMGRLAAKKAIGLLRPNSLPSEIDIIPGLLENPVILGIKPINLNISISHTKSYAFAAAMSSICPIGVDTETINEENFNEYICLSTKNEIKLTMKIFNEDELKAAARLWTLKESLSKTIKCGFTIPLELFEIISYEEITQRCIFKNFTQFRATSFIFNNNMFSICLPYSLIIDNNFPKCAVDSNSGIN